MRISLFICHETFRASALSFYAIDSTSIKRCQRLRRASSLILQAAVEFAMSSRRGHSRAPTERGNSPHPRPSQTNQRAITTPAINTTQQQLSSSSSQQHQQQPGNPKQHGKLHRRIQGFFEKDKDKSFRDGRHHSADHNSWRDSPYGAGVERARMQIPESRWKQRSASHSHLPEIISPDNTQLDTSGLSSHLETDGETIDDTEGNDSVSIYTARPGTRDTGRAPHSRQEARDREPGRDRDRLDPGNQSFNGAESFRSPSPSPSARTGSLWERYSNSGSTNKTKGRKHFMDKIRRYQDRKSVV